jgi:hypothetical protein
VRGDLDWIVMKALEKDRARRYETANGFALDVQRYLADEAVHACPPSGGYRLRVRAAKQGRPGGGGAVLFFLVLLGSGVIGRCATGRRQAKWPGRLSRSSPRWAQLEEQKWPEALAAAWRAGRRGRRQADRDRGRVASD